VFLPNCQRSKEAHPSKYGITLIAPRYYREQNPPVSTQSGAAGQEIRPRAGTIATTPPAPDRATRGSGDDPERMSVRAFRGKECHSPPSKFASFGARGFPWFGRRPSVRLQLFNG
jgi:hypothetical protein